MTVQPKYLNKNQALLKYKGQMKVFQSPQFASSEALLKCKGHLRIEICL